jgi:hypothetical protein
MIRTQLCLQIAGHGVLVLLFCAIFWCICIIYIRLGVGVSSTGKMVGPNTAASTAVICNPGNTTVMTQTYRLTDYTYAGLVPFESSGVWGMSCEQDGGNTVMRWSRNVSDGVSSDASIVTNGSDTFVIWAIGESNSLGPSSYPTMMDVSSVLLWPGSSVTVSPSVAPTASNSPSSSVVLTSGLQLNWSVVAGVSFVFEAVLSQVAW